MAEAAGLNAPRPADTAQPTWRGELRVARGASLPDGLSKVSCLLETLSDFLKTLPHLDATASANLRLVCDELASNAVRHSASNREVVIRVEIFRRGSGVHLVYTDNGAPFNPLAQVQPYIGGDLDRRRVGGLGLYLIKQIFPNARYLHHNGWNSTQVDSPVTVPSSPPP